MIIENRKKFENYISSLKELGNGSQGTVYFDHKISQCLKVFYDVFSDDEDYSYTLDASIIRFKEYSNHTYYFNQDLVIVEDKIVGCTLSLVQGKTIDEINPLRIKIDSFISAVEKVEKDIKFISDNGILSFDVLYNIMYGKSKIGIIDTTEYGFSQLPPENLYKQNSYNFNIGIMLFLVDTYFDEFVESYKILKEMYYSKDTDIKEFLSCFKKYLCEYIGDDIVTLNAAKKVCNKQKRKQKFVRKINISNIY